MEAQVRGDPDPYPEGAAGGVAGPSSVPTPGPETRSKRQISAATGAPGKVEGPVGPGDARQRRRGDVDPGDVGKRRRSDVGEQEGDRKRKSRRRNVIDSDEEQEAVVVVQEEEEEEEVVPRRPKKSKVYKCEKRGCKYSTKKNQ